AFENRPALAAASSRCRRQRTGPGSIELSHKVVPGNDAICEDLGFSEDLAMRSYRVDSKTVRIEASDDAESIVLEVVRTGLARSRADRNDPPLINSSYARAMRTGPGRSSSSSQAASVAAGPGTSEAAAAGIRRHRLKLSE